MFPVSFDLSQLLHSTSTCFNATTSIKTGSSCGLTAGLDKTGFSENDQQSGVRCAASAIKDLLKL